MTHGHAHEEAEHASHHAHDPFDRRVALSMVVIAAVLATVKVLGHRAHNDTLDYQIQAGVAHTQASNTFSFFQAKRQRLELALLQASQLLQLVPLGKEGPPYKDEPLPNRAALLASVTQDLKDERVADADAQAAKLLAEADARFAELRRNRFPVRPAEQVVRLELSARRYRLEADAINDRAKKEREAAEKLQQKSAHRHAQANWFDFGELGVELALVLASVAILSKRKPFWYGGLAVGAVGAVLVVVGLLV